jgi:hypothetical protein
MRMSAFGGKGDIPARFFAVLARAKPLTTLSFYMALWHG